MNQCLTIVEVQRVIFHQVRREHKGLATLAGLARTCRIFSSTALDVLWEDLESFVCLIRCLPLDLLEMEPDADCRTMAFQRPMSRRDWEIFFAYSSRVRILRRTDCWNLDENIIFGFSNPPTFGPLIPRLKILVWDVAYGPCASLLRLFLTPSLVTLVLESCYLVSPEVSILISIGAICPALKNLSIPSDGPLPNSFDAKGRKVLSETLLYMHSLETFACPVLDETAIAHICHLPFLVDLSLELQFNFQPDKLLPHLLPTAFASLNKLNLRVSALSILTSFIELMRFKPTSVSFVVANAPTPDELHLFFVTLATSCGSERLSQVSLTTSGRHGGVPHPQVSLFTLEPLLPFPSIQDFKFDMPFDIALDDDAITMLTKGWPNLTKLSLNAISGWGIRSRVTHHGLITLLSRCPALMELALAIDFSVIDVLLDEIPKSCTGNGVTNETCRVADFVTSTIKYPGSIAAFLSDACPNLREVGSAWDHFDIRMEDKYADAYVDRWLEVSRSLPALTAVRRQSKDRPLREVDATEVDARPA